ncbi:MAG: hypothetical protein J7M19_03950 [Planctomycetes bacterium]|nr:hypothetical protein [Planctomycetota bacterium]
MSASDDSFSWIELAGITPRAAMIRNRFVRAEDLQAVKTWRERFDNRDVYASVCRFAKPTRDADFFCDFFLDIDSDNLNTAREEALRAFYLLVDHLGLRPEWVDLFFSGAKGFHVIVPHVVFGSPKASEIMRVWKALAGRLVSEGLEHIDLGVYQKSRVLRLPNSLNSKSGLYKVPLEYKELRDFGLDYVLELAREPRDEDSLAMPEEGLKAAAWFREALTWWRTKRAGKTPRSNSTTKFSQGWRVPPCIRNIEQATLPDGIRHTAYLALARFYAWIGMHALEAEERIGLIDEKHSVRDSACIARIVEFGGKHPGFPGCDNPVLKKYCDRKRCFLPRIRRNKTQGQLTAGVE